MRFEVDIERHYFEECSLKGLETRIWTKSWAYPTYLTVQITDSENYDYRRQDYNNYCHSLKYLINPVKYQTL